MRKAVVGNYKNVQTDGKVIVESNLLNPRMIRCRCRLVKETRTKINFINKYGNEGELF